MKKKFCRKTIIVWAAAALMFAGCGQREEVEKAGAEPYTEESVITISANDQDGSELQEAHGANTEVKKEAEYIVLKNPSYQAFSSIPEGDFVQPFSVGLLSETANQITDTQDWFALNELYLNFVSAAHAYGETARHEGDVFDYEKWRAENRVCFYDDTYLYTVESMEGRTDSELAPYMECILNAYDKETEEVQFTFDFSDFCFGSEQSRDAGIYTELAIQWAQMQEDILYVALSYNGYARENTSFLVAVSLQTQEVLWKSESLVCNSFNFLIKDNILLCGYGFTAEPDFLYQLDLKTGRIIGQTPLESKPDYLVWKNDQLYVRCYDTDYIFSLERREQGLPEEYSQE